MNNVNISVYSKKKEMTMNILKPILSVSLFITGCTTTTTPEPPILVGLADFHTHQFAHLGFGGTILSHSTDPTAPCLPILPHDKTTMKMVDLVRDGFLAEATDQAKTGACFPTLTNLASQRMDTDNLHRAWQYGLRLMGTSKNTPVLLTRNT